MAIRSAFWRKEKAETATACDDCEVVERQKDILAQVNFFLQRASLSGSCADVCCSQLLRDESEPFVMPKFNEMKRVRSAGILLCGAVLAIAPAMALQCAPPAAPQGDAQGPPPGGRGGRGGMNPERRLEMMQKELSLTADQTTAIKAVFEDERTKMEAARSADASLSPEDRRAKMMAMRQEENTKIEAVLTPDQKTKYEAMMAKQRERMENRQGGGPPPPPPQ